MLKVIQLLFISIAALSAVACTPVAIVPPPTATSIATNTPAPTPTPVRVASCGDLDANWGHNWPAVLEAIDILIANGQSCGEEPLLSKKYAVHFNYGAALEGEGKLAEAAAQFQAAFAIDAQRRPALEGLIRLDALPQPTPPNCLSASPPRPEPTPFATAAPTAEFVSVQGNQLWLDGRPFELRGVNYYPRHAPWRRFWTQADASAMSEEFDLIKAAGFNTVRIFLWNEPLFTCQPEEAIPNEAAFKRVDTVFELAAERDLKLIVSLNDLPDLVYRPLYTDPAATDARTTYIVRRYRHAPALLAWDVRNGGDLDINEAPGRFDEADIVAWLGHVTRLIRRHDANHLITAAWHDDLQPTAPHVDFLSFQYWGNDLSELRDKLTGYNFDKPLVLMAFGEPGWRNAPEGEQSEGVQAQKLGEIVQYAKSQEVAGWLVWSAFDFTPDPGLPVNNGFFFGLWRTDLSPKPALNAIREEW